MEDPLPGEWHGGFRNCRKKHLNGREYAFIDVARSNELDMCHSRKENIPYEQVDHRNWKMTPPVKPIFICGMASFGKELFENLRTRFEELFN